MRFLVIRLYYRYIQSTYGAVYTIYLMGGRNKHRFKLVKRQHKLRQLYLDNEVFRSKVYHLFIVIVELFVSYPYISSGDHLPFTTSNLRQMIFIIRSYEYIMLNFCELMIQTHFQSHNLSLPTKLFKMNSNKERYPFQMVFTIQ